MHTARTLQELPCGITVIDTGFERPRFAASHLIVEQGRAAFVDVGPSAAAGRLLDALARKGLAPDAVAYVIVTHVHLDHAGGAGTLMRHLPRARLVVHPRGAAHLIDPQRLLASAAAVYGERRLRASFGEVSPVPASRIIEARDGFVLSLGGRRLTFLDTPGHARHHVCIVDEKSRGIFAGDTFGLAYPEFTTRRGAFVIPTTSPVQFDPRALHASIDRLLTYRPECFYLTHYGRVTDAVCMARDLHARLDAFVALAERLRARSARRRIELIEGMEALLLEELQRHGCALDRDTCRRLLAIDLELNAQGIEIWLDRRGGRGPHGGD